MRVNKVLFQFGTVLVMRVMYVYRVLHVIHL